MEVLFGIKPVYVMVRMLERLVALRSDIGFVQWMFWSLEKKVRNACCWLLGTRGCENEAKKVFFRRSSVANYSRRNSAS